jgi:plasmid stabilization system protein ParE
MIIYNKQTSRRISDIVFYIEEQGFPQNAANYKIKLYKFAENLQFYPDKYPICRFTKYHKKGYHCAPFDDYIFVYKIQNNDIILINVLHSKRLIY